MPVRVDIDAKVPTYSLEFSAGAESVRKLCQAQIQYADFL